MEPITVKFLASFVTGSLRVHCMPLMYVLLGLVQTVTLWMCILLLNSVEVRRLMSEKFVPDLDPRGPVEY